MKIIVQRFRHHREAFLVEGNINASTVKQFKSHLEFLLLFNKSLTLNMDGLKTIEENGLKVIKEMHTASLLWNKKFIKVLINSNRISHKK